MAANPRPRRGFLFPGLLIVAGVTLLIAMLGGLPDGYLRALVPFWPVVIIAVGVSLLVSRIRPWIGSTAGLVVIVGTLAAAWPLAEFEYFGLEGTVQEFSVQRRDALSARVGLEIGAAGLDLRATGDPAVLTSGTFTSCGEESLRVNVSQHDRERTVRLSSADYSTPGLFKCGRSSWGLHEAWVIALTAVLPTALEINSGVSDAEVDLEDLRITRLDMKTGAGDAHITLPRAPGHMSAYFDLGAGRLHIDVPKDVAIRVDVEGGVLSLEIDEDRFTRREVQALAVGYDELYVSPDFATAKNRVDIKIRAGASEISVKSIR